ncbi:hypothetical protein VTL71DRAFT_9306 [Oculimacula yallundae]|uniref:Uncharacterized protein n=1 Tax=Oculimacula yallundae TaxID=86028 RepID=A0ABR4BSP1_9HELO
MLNGRHNVFPGPRTRTYDVPMLCCVLRVSVLSSESPSGNTFEGIEPENQRNASSGTTHESFNIDFRPGSFGFHDGPESIFYIPFGTDLICYPGNMPTCLFSFKRKSPPKLAQG